MLSDQLSHLMERATDGPTSAPDIGQILADARRRQRGRRIVAAGGIASLATVVVGAVAVLGHSDGVRELGAAGSPRYPIAVSTRYHPKFDTTCEVLTFTETGAHIDGLCLQVFTRDALPTGFFQLDDYRMMRVTTGGAPTMIVSGDVNGTGTIVVTDAAGHKVRANVLPALPGHPVSMFYADLGNSNHRPLSVRYTPSNGKVKVEPVPPPATPSAPPSPN